MVPSRIRYQYKTRVSRVADVGFCIPNQYVEVHQRSREFRKYRFRQNKHAAATFSDKSTGLRWGKIPDFYPVCKTKRNCRLIPTNSHRTRDATRTHIGTQILWCCLCAVWTLPLRTTGPICLVALCVVLRVLCEWGLGGNFCLFAQEKLNFSLKTCCSTTSLCLVFQDLRIVQGAGEAETENLHSLAAARFHWRFAWTRP